VLRHRLVPTFHADAEGITADDIVKKTARIDPAALTEAAARI